MLSEHNVYVNFAHRTLIYTTHQCFFAL